jgi:hypothetical protein
MKLRTHLSLFVISLTIFCTPLHSQNVVEFKEPNKDQLKVSETLGRPAEGKTRIVFKRVSGAMGAVVPHMIVDCGDSIVYNTLIVQKEKFADFDGNFDKARNIEQVYFMDDKGKFQLIQGTPLPNDKLITDKNEVVKKSLLFPDLLLGNKDHEVTIKGFWISTVDLKAKCHIEGFVKSGQSLAWDRAPGKVKIEVVVPNGDQGFCPSFKAEAGHTYFIDYYYMKAKFVIADLK